MKICIFTYSVTTYGGVQRCVTKFANELLNKGYIVDIICLKNTNKNIFNLNSNINVHYIEETHGIFKIINKIVGLIKRLDRRNCCFRNFPNVQKRLYFGIDFKKNNKILEILKSINPDYIITTELPMILRMSVISEKFNCKYIGWQHSTSVSYFENNNFFLNKLYSNEVKKLNQYIVLTHYDVQWLKEKYNIESKCIYNFKSFESKKVSKLDEKRIISVGRLVPSKNFELLIKGFSLISDNYKDWKLDIFGEGVEKDKLSKLIDSLNMNNRIKLLPFTNNIQEEYLKSSIFSIMSKYEGFGLVLVEAMECGLPIICSNIDSFRELMSDESGIVLKENTPDQVKRAFEYLMQNKEIMLKMATNAKKRSKYFSNETIIKEWLKILK